MTLRNPRLHQLAFTLQFACLLFFAEAQSAETSASIWPQWRGPGRDGQFHGPAWPEQLSTNNLRQLWRVEIGPSYSGPIVAGDRVFTTETKDKSFEGVTALGRATGRQLWRVQWEGAMTVPFFAKANGDWIRATPALDGVRLRLWKNWSASLDGGWVLDRRFTFDRENLLLNGDGAPYVQFSVLAMF